MVLKRGKVLDKFCFQVDGIVIPSITEKPVRSLRDATAIQANIRELESWLSTVKKLI